MTASLRTEGTESNSKLFYVVSCITGRCIVPNGPKDFKEYLESETKNTEYEKFRDLLDEYRQTLLEKYPFLKNKGIDNAVLQYIDLPECNHKSQPLPHATETLLSLLRENYISEDDKKDVGIQRFNFENQLRKLM